MGGFVGCSSIKRELEFEFRSEDIFSFSTFSQYSLFSIFHQEKVETKALKTILMNNFGSVQVGLKLDLPLNIMGIIIRMHQS